MEEKLQNHHQSIEVRIKNTCKYFKREGIVVYILEVTLGEEAIIDFW